MIINTGYNKGFAINNKYLQQIKRKAGYASFIMALNENEYSIINNELVSYFNINYDNSTKYESESNNIVEFTLTNNKKLSVIRENNEFYLCVDSVKYEKLYSTTYTKLVYACSEFNDALIIRAYTNENTNNCAFILYIPKKRDFMLDTFGGYFLERKEPTTDKYDNLKIAVLNNSYDTL